MKPCEQSCPKCGGSDNQHLHRRAGAVFRVSSFGAPTKWESAFLTFEGSYATAAKECITHHCTTCQFDWETEVYTPKAQAEAQPSLEGVPDDVVWKLHGPFIQKTLEEVLGAGTAASLVECRSRMARMLLERRLQPPVPFPSATVPPVEQPNNEAPAVKLERLVSGLTVRVEAHAGFLIVDLNRPSKDDSKEFAGPRFWVNRAVDDNGRSGWKILIHPDDGDPVLCVFARDDGKVRQQNYRHEETQWPVNI